jgi:CRP/FNR family transcriptional regulator
MYPGLISHIRKQVVIGEEEIAIILQYMKPLPVKKKGYLLKEGQVCRSNYFVEKGCLRLFFINEKGTEQITQFAIENWWLADYMSLQMQVPSQFYIQAIEDTEVFVIDHLLLDELLQKVPAMERYFRLIMQRAYAATQVRFKFLSTFSKEESYRHFTESFPGFAQRIPQYMMASYLGLTPEYLSGIRKKTR